MKQRLIDFIKNSNLAESDKNSWEVLINASPESFASGFWEVFSEYPDELKWFNDTLKRKREAFEIIKTDKEKGQQILEGIYIEEMRKIEELANKGE